MPRSRVRVPLSPPINSKIYARKTQSGSLAVCSFRASIFGRNAAILLIKRKRSIFHTLGLELAVPGQQRLDLLDGLRSRQLGEQAAQVRIRLQFVGPRGLNQAVKMGARLGAADRVGEEPVAAPEGKGADRVLSEIGVDGDFAVRGVADEFRPLFE